MDRYIDEYTGKPVYNEVIYEYKTENNEEYRITYKRHGDINKTCFVDILPKVLGVLAKLVGFDGKIVENVSDPAVWELMYFGHVAADEKYRNKLD